MLATPPAARPLSTADRGLFLRRRAEQAGPYTVDDFHRDQDAHFERMRRKGYNVVDSDSPDAWC